jgi:hypothetical protein
MTMLELLKEYPNSANIVRQWFLNKMLNGLKDDSIPEGFKEYMKQKGVDDEKITDILQNSPRSMFDVFDDNGLYIEITRADDHFWWAVNSSVYQEKYSTRKDAEKAAISESFKLLNEKLNEGQNS